MQQPGCDLGCRMVVERSNGSRTAEEQDSNRSCKHRLTHSCNVSLSSLPLNVPEATTTRVDR